MLQPIALGLKDRQFSLARGEVVSVIAGATSAAQVRSNAAASAWRMTEAERSEVAALTAD